MLLAAGGTSDGGDQFRGVTTELGVAFRESFELGCSGTREPLAHPDQTPAQPVLRNAVARVCAGSRHRGVAMDVGINASPDPLLGEPRRLHFSIGPI